MVRDEQVRFLRKKMKDGLTQEAAAAATGMSERTARKWQRGPLLLSRTVGPSRFRVVTMR